MDVDNKPASDDVESTEAVRFIFGLLDDINKRIDVKLPAGILDYLCVSEIQMLVDDNINSKNYKFSEDGQRLIHFILYLNTEMTNCNWVREYPLLNLKQYVHGDTLSNNLYYKLVDILNLKPFISEIIMYTPYSFCSDLIDISLNKIKAMDGLSQLVDTENLVISLMKSVKRGPIKSNSESSVIAHFNQAMLVFGKDNLPHDIRRLDFEDEQKEITRYNGFRVKSIFNIFIEMIKYRSVPDTYKLYPLYTLTSLRSSIPSTDTGHVIFKKCFDVIMYKCMNMCNFSIDTWIAWYEVEVVEEDTNLQAAIGHLCYELCSLIDNGTINERLLKEFRPILRNIAIEKIDFSNIDITDIDAMAKRVESSSKFHLNAWVKKMIENPGVFVHNRAIQVIGNYIDCVDYNCFKAIIDSSMAYHKSGGEVSEALGKVIFKGLKHLDLEDTSFILRHVMIYYADCTFYVSNDFDELLHYVTHNEYNENIDPQELLSTLIWLIIQQPRKMLNLLISQYVTGICGLPVKGIESKRSCCHQGLVGIHAHMDPSYIYQEYMNWLSFDLNLSVDQKQNLRQWILGTTKHLRVMKPKAFLSYVLLPLLNPSPNYDHMLFLATLTKMILNECHIMTLPYIEIWDTLLIKLAKILDDARWSINNYTSIKVEICEKMIVTIQPLLHYVSYIDNQVKAESLENIKQELSGLHLMTRSHFLRLWTSEYITIDGMDEHLIMTIQSQSHISYSNLNRSSTQRAQEEFIFSIATYMPKFTLHEMKSFIANYLSSAKPPNMIDASFFLLESVMNSIMRIIVYLKTAVQNEPYDNQCAWAYVENTIVNFLDAVNTSKMCCIYEDEINVTLAINSVTKIVMVIKQLENIRQMPLLIVIRRLIDLIVTRMETAEISKVLSLLASIKSPNSRKTLRTSIQRLMNNLIIKKQRVEEVSHQG